MRTKSLAICILLFFVLVLTGCGGSDSKGSADNLKPEEKAGSAPSTASTEKADNEPSEADGDIKKISQLSDAWRALHKQHERAINNYQGMPLMELLNPDVFFMIGVQYEFLNSDDTPGRHEGKLLGAGWPAFIEKSGDTINFGYDTVREKNGFAPYDKAGDKLVASGAFDTAAGYLVSEDSVEQGGEKIKRSYFEFRRLDDGSMIGIALNGNVFTGKGDREPHSSAVYVKMSKDSYEFVIAKGKTGPGFQTTSIKDKENMTKDEAKAAFTGAGYSIEKTGGVKDSVFYID